MQTIKLQCLQQKQSYYLFNWCLPTLSPMLSLFVLLTLKKKNNLAHFYSCELKNLKVAGTYSQQLKKKILHDFTNPIQGCVKFLFVESSQIKLILLVSTPL